MALGQCLSQPVSAFAAERRVHMIEIGLIVRSEMLGFV